MSQLAYIDWQSMQRLHRRVKYNDVATIGFEPMTFWLWARRATELLYVALYEIKCQAVTNQMTMLIGW